ncbi:HNH endonuclease [Paraburkholderia tropica]|uniref:HNH endonuclease n=1 Tax=Paraburkholderia tropica TaxID=92647 RepID=UPI0016028D1B|nr:HNH endonuclease [Paraburkholderia tropica]QNB14270.1 HNH endonuclease [Paraburkholderia tropica]
MTRKILLCGRKAEARISYETANEFFHYDAETGAITLKNDVATLKTKQGEQVGSKIASGYIQVYVPEIGSVYAHRLAFLLMTGSWPKNIVDHINHIPDDNRWENLRDVDYSANNHNSKLRKDNTSGVRGVRYEKRKNRYSATVKHQKKGYWLGYFDTIEEATAALLAKYEELGIYKDNDCIFASNQNL